MLNSTTGCTSTSVSPGANRAERLNIAGWRAGRARASCALRARRVAATHREAEKQNARPRRLSPSAKSQLEQRRA
eukprot:scaffold3865_cov38-Tisochrysis_lutea.AAC.1